MQSILELTFRDSSICSNRTTSHYFDLLAPGSWICMNSEPIDPQYTLWKKNNKHFVFKCLNVHFAVHSFLPINQLNFNSTYNI